MAFMKYSDRRDLREKMYRLYSGRNVSGDFNNLPVMKEIAETRMHLARLLGYETFAHYRPEKSMAKTLKRSMSCSIRCAMPIAPQWKPSSANFRLMPRRLKAGR